MLNYKIYNRYNNLDVPNYDIPELDGLEGNRGHAGRTLNPTHQQATTWPPSEKSWRSHNKRGRSS